jgi:Ca-activated chloride channel family protein
MTQPAGEPDPSQEAARPFLLEETDARVTVTGTIAHAVVTQTWHNPNARPVNGLYVFPLPQDAAVNDMRLEVGDRVIQSEMKRREEARKVYEQAKREGKLAGLLDQERPNVFAQRVANLMPGERVRVVIRYDQPVERADGRYELVFPTVVGPRFVPVEQTDPGEILPPVAADAEGTPQQLSLTVSLEAGMPIAGLESSTHPIAVRREGEGRATVRLARNGHERLDRDFTLSWSLAGKEPRLGVLAYRDPDQGERGTFSVFLEPPAAPETAKVTPRELVFVLDCSGSMRGAPLNAAKDVVRRVLGSLHPRDSFQIIRFSESASGLSRKPLANTPGNVQRALSYLDALRGGGGTRMIEGIKASLDGQTDSERMRVVAFLTDGYIGNEREILAAVRQRLGDARLFGFGIGSSVNRYLLEGLAEEGRGAAAFRTPRESADELVRRFVERISSPVLTDVRVAFEDVEAFDIEPMPIPDLFAGQPLVISGRYRTPGAGTLIVEGKIAGEPVTFREVLRLPERSVEHEALGRLWARARIHRLERELHGGKDEDVVERITSLALRHRLMTRYTSLVAVDSDVSNPSGEALEVEVPVELPQDVPTSALGAKQVGVALGQPLPSRTAGEALHRTAPPRGRPSANLDIVVGDPEPAEEEARTAPEQAFEALSLFEADGSELRIEADGEVWQVTGGRRSLRTVLRAEPLRELRRLLAASDPRSWTVPSGAKGAHLVAIIGESPFAVAVDGAAADVERLARRLRELASGGAL